MNPMTDEQFEVLRDWIDRRVYLRAEIDRARNDRPFVAARLRELEDADDRARRTLTGGDQE